jgi:hypothetical protein
MIDINASIEEVSGIISALLAAEGLTIKSNQLYTIRAEVLNTQLPALDIASGPISSKMKNRAYTNESTLLAVLRLRHVDRPESAKAFNGYAYKIGKGLEGATGQTFDIVSQVDISPGISENGEGSYVFEASMQITLFQER